MTPIACFRDFTVFALFVFTFRSSQFNWEVANIIGCIKIKTCQAVPIFLFLLFEKIFYNKN
ncbi:MAG: hypothetical protein A3G49_02845 [Candidatus Sungbacteria bacterium RIFCSPLOWO2_12_FULL_41_11]|uniref:Uncharacterized protein n=1 Tax=Candidatus Sungbacteria bacterium RIFCSPLOWO2_12_FULL_41_11 TaxID=1802286 RepID=A0A1G2LRM7_9BACT|nr:MAG: hypothetical protein A3D41_01845 [Candidatus Sungbacteria bacterium RIFCSPHIGHO2_02_FULL_41_12b]OHA14154.1 MAG: hypothetical protein A3G49_02845 [Candidatus Sungbacteria bacterium RIFCSPLOWO2_12_FULL_41_11]